MYVLSHSVIPTLCDPMDCIPPGSSNHGISQARILEWDVISFSRVICVCVCVCMLLFWIIFHYRLLQDIEYSSMCYTVSTCLYLSIYMHVYFNLQLLIYPSFPFPFGNHKFVFCVSLLCVVAQSCLTLWDCTHCTLPGSSVHGILQVRILEWDVISFSRGLLLCYQSGRFKYF